MRTAIAIVFLATAAITHAQVDPARVVAKVNGTPIHGREYYKRMETQPGLGTASGGKFTSVYPGYLTMRWLIEEELLIQLAKEQGVAPTPAQVDAEYQSRLKENPEQFKAFVQFGFTEEDMERSVLVDMSEFNILTQGVTVTDFEVEKFYNDFKTTRFTLPKRYTLRIIRISGEAGKKPVDDALGRGEKFADVASKHSIDLSRLDGGRIGEFPEADMSPSTRTVIAATRKGATTAWIEQNGEFAKFYVEDIKESEIVPLDAKLKKQIRDNLMRDRGSVRNNMMQMMADFRKKAVLEFNNFPFADDLKRHFSVGG
jgi:foldase protein PrsA